MHINLALFTYGGIHPELLDCLLAEMLACRTHGVTLDYNKVGSDALISRSRSVALSQFLEGTKAEVFFMLDHDLEWETGAIVATCQKAIEANAVVGGIYASRARGYGISSRLAAEEVTVTAGADELHPAEYVGGGFMAIPRAIAERVLRVGVSAARVSGGRDDQALRECLYMDGRPFWDFFRPCVVPSRMHPGKNEYLSEDWAFCHRVREVGGNLFLWSAPWLRHHGDYAYTLEDAWWRGQPGNRDPRAQPATVAAEPAPLVVGATR